MNFKESTTRGIRLALLAGIVGASLAITVTVPTKALSASMQCSDLVSQDPTQVFRSGLWKQWIYWAIPGPSAYAAVQRIVAEVNVVRAGAGLPLLVTNPAYEIVLSVFDERNARGANGSSALPVTSNQEAFLATFVDDAAGGFEVLFLADPLRSNNILTTKGVPGIPATVERSMEFEIEKDIDKISTKWEMSSAAGDVIKFGAHYPSTAVFYHGVAPASRIDYANCNLKHVSDIIYRSSPTKTYPLFAREEANYIDLTRSDVHVKVRVQHHDLDVNEIFNDPGNIPELLIALDRDVRIENR